MRRKAIIIGAGIAGPILAIQLKELGYEVEVFEARAEDNMQEGVFLGITPNGLNVLKHFFPLEMLKEDYTPGTMRFFNRKGVQIAELPSDYQQEKYGSETLMVKRPHLNNIIRREAMHKGVGIHYGKKCVLAEEIPEGVRVAFADGHIVQGDILIGCDGVFSMVRKNIFPEAEKPAYTKDISTGGYARLPELNKPLDTINMTFGERGFFAYSVSNHKEIWWFNNYFRNQEPNKKGVQPDLKDEIKNHLLAIHKNDDPLFSRIINASDEILAYPVYDIPKLDKWYTDRICLVGDAAHATSPHVGQGASLALEDTVVLAGCLKKYDTPEIAFAHFQKIRQGRVEKIVKQARKVGNTKKSGPNPIASWFRDKFLRYFIKGEIKRTDWIYGYRPTL